MILDFAGLFRNFWAYGLNEIETPSQIDLKGWILNGSDYQIHSPINSDNFIISTYSRENFLLPISKDCNRFNCSAIESVVKCSDQSILPNSVSWLLLRQYYAAFYSAHSILRMLGKSLTQIDNIHKQKIEQIADLYLQRNGVNINAGYYMVEYRSNDRQIFFKKATTSSSSGSHKVLWKIFGEELKYINNTTLSNPSTQVIQNTVIKIEDLLYNLSYISSPNYRWLSTVRNEINYQHKYNVWFPNKLNSKELKAILSTKNSWNDKPEKIELKNLTGQELLRFSNTCKFIIALCIEVSLDMHGRSSSEASFHKMGIKKIMNLVA